MENIEADLGNGFFEDIASAFSEYEESAIEIENHSDEQIDLAEEVLSTSDMMADISEAFEKNIMNEHIATVDLLGDLGYTDMLLYYYVVMDCLFLNNESENNEQQIEVITPSQYINEKETVKKATFEADVKCSTATMEKLKKVLRYFKKRKFEIVSNTFYADGSDIVIFLSLKTSFGYGFNVKLTFNCDSINQVIDLSEKIQQIQNKFAAGDNIE